MQIEFLADIVQFELKWNAAQIPHFHPLSITSLSGLLHHFFVFFLQILLLFSIFFLVKLSLLLVRLLDNLLQIWLIVFVILEIVLERISYIVLRSLISFKFTFLIILLLLPPPQFLNHFPPFLALFLDPFIYFSSTLKVSIIFAPSLCIQKQLTRQFQL